MKQIIPFKKELLFKTKVCEITSISLEHTLMLKENDLISGEFHITGDYKMTEGSINREKFNFKLPFDIALDSRYNIDTIIIDIDNFYYEIVNNEALQVNIDVYVEGEKIEEPLIVEKEQVLEPSIIEEEKMEELSILKEERAEVIEDRNKIDEFEDLFKEEYKPAVSVSKPEPMILNVEKTKKVEENTDMEFNLSTNIETNETYATYYVYIVKEEDTLDKILEKYSVTKESVSYYNDLENIKPGIKLIIPSNCNE